MLADPKNGTEVTDHDLKGLVAVGKVRDGHGLKGELFLIFYAREAPWIDQVKSLTFVQTIFDKEKKSEIKKRYDFLKSRFKPHKIGAIVKVEGVEDRNDSEYLRGAIIYIPANLLTSRPGEMVYLREVLGFEVKHEDRGVVGTVAGFSSNGAQDLLVIEMPDGKNQFEVPFISDFVDKIAWEEKQIQMSFPEELVETFDAIPTKK